jgi:hypothetical protein
MTTIKMKVYQDHRKLFISAVIFILLIHNSGCTSYRIISSYDLPSPEKYHYTIYGHSSRYPLENTIISNDSISGKVNRNRSYKINSIHIYPVTDSVIKINSENILRIPMNSIARVEKSGSAEEKNHPTKKANKPKAAAGAVILGILTASIYAILHSRFR